MDDESVFYFHFSLDPERPGLLCKVHAQMHRPLIELAREVFREARESHPRQLLRAEIGDLDHWVYLFGKLDIEVEELEPEQTPYDLAIMPGGTIYLGPRAAFRRWLEGKE
jgi:hypothetical protein